MTIHYGGTNASYDDIKEAVLELKELAEYYCIGFETCPTTGGTHLQCVFQWKVRQRRSRLMRIIRCYCEEMRGPIEDAADYCKGVGVASEIKGKLPNATVEEHGTMRGTKIVKAAARSAGGQTRGLAVQEEWNRIRDICENGGDLADIPAEYYLKYNAPIMALRKRHMPMPKPIHWENNETPNLWLYGETGCGKSRWASETYPGAYRKMCNKWFDGHIDDHQGENVMIIDDFDREHKCLGHHLKIWGDRYGHIAEFKGGASGCRFDIVIITSNFHPSEIWEDEQTLGPILRRYKVKNMSPFKKQFVLATPSAVAPTFVAPGLSQPQVETCRMSEDDEPDENDGLPTTTDMQRAFQDK